MDEVKLRGKIRVKIYYEDMDLSGFVYHANYLKYFDRGREEVVGVKALKDWHADGLHFVVAEADLKYHAPVHLGDELEIRSEVSVSRSPSHTYKQEAWRENTLCCSAKIRIVALNAEHRPTRLSPAYLKHLATVCPGAVK